MNKRKSMSKTLRFEVFKRDSFSCQYCGATPSTKELEVDHIQPVAKGGGNDMMNLTTSCFDCNRGKAARELSDDSVVVKQKKQLDKLEERRQQFKMMYEWRKELDNLSSETDLMIIEYIESKIAPYVITKSGKKELEKTITKYEFDDILNAIDISASAYLCYGDDDSLEKDSTYNFFSKITGILVNLSRSPLELKVAHIKSIGRRQFGNWNPQQGAIVLSKILRTMRSKGSSDESILTVLENTIEPMTQESKNWAQWNCKIEEFLGTLEDITVAAATPPQPKLGSNKRELLLEQNVVDSFIDSIGRALPPLFFTGHRVAAESDLTYSSLCTWVLNYLKSLKEFYRKGDSLGKEEPHMADYDGHLGVVVTKLETPWEIGYYEVHRRFWISIEDCVGYDDYELEDEDFQFIISCFQSKIDFTSSKLYPDAARISHSQIPQAAIEALTGTVTEVLGVVDKVVPALVDIGRNFVDIKEYALKRAIYFGVINYWLVCWFESGTNFSPRLASEFRGLRIFELGEKSEDNPLQHSLRKAYALLLDELIEPVNEYKNGSVEVASENYNFLINLFAEEVKLKLTDLYHKEVESIDKKSKKPTKGNNVIPFPSRD